MERIVIIGAGLTGLSAAYHCEKKNLSYTIFEKESEIGGLCRSVCVDGFTFDYTGHLLHKSDNYFSSLIDTYVGNDFFYAIDRRSFIYSSNTYTPYPFQVNLRGLPTSVITECVAGFMQRKRYRKKPVSFREWVNAQFGSGFGKHFFFPYQRKIFDYSVDKLTASWTGRFVPTTSLDAIIDGIVGGNEKKSIGYNASFLYPKAGGIVSWVQKFSQALIHPIHTDFCVSRIHMGDKIVEFSNGHSEPYDVLITTMPLDCLLALLEEPSSVSVKKAADYLICNSVINFNLGIKHTCVSDKHWIYFPEKMFPFYRIGFPHNFSPATVPEGCSSLYGEFSYIKKSRQWVNKTLTYSLNSVKKTLALAESDIIVQKTIPISHAYVIYDTWRDSYLTKIHDQLRAHNIYSVGRYGEWKYSSMQEAVLDGRHVIDIIEQKKDSNGRKNSSFLS